MIQKTLKKDHSYNKFLSYSSVRNLNEKNEHNGYSSRVKCRPSMKDSISYSRVSLFDYEKQEFPVKRNQFSMINLQYPSKTNQQQKSYYLNKAKCEGNLKYQAPPSTRYGSQASSFFDLKRILSKKDLFWKKKNGDLKNVKHYDHMQVLSSNFLSSFKVVFNELIETYFLQIYLKKKIRYLTFQIWNHILKSAGPTFIQKKQNVNLHQIDIKVIFNALKNVFPNQFRQSQIQQAIKVYFPSKTHVSYSDFQILMNFEKDIMDFLVERSYEKKFGNISPSKLINTFLKTLIQYADFEKKLRMISKANSNELITFLITLSKDQTIQILKFANLLDESENYLPSGMRQTQTKLNNFFEAKINKKFSKSEFLNWLKIENLLFQLNKKQ